jgi:hypothetical protein
MIRPADGVGSIPLIHVPETQSGVIGGVKRCRSVWICPYCGTEISEARRVELRESADIWRLPIEEGGYFAGRLAMATYTVRHSASTPVKSLVQALKAAYRQMKKSANYRRLCDRYGVAGSVTTMELKHSEENGWHPHFHELLYVYGWFDIVGFERELRRLWEVACAKFNLSMNHYGLHLTDCDQEIIEYITKYRQEPAWTESEELSKWHLKVGATGQRREFSKHYTPFQLLRFALEGDERAGVLFQEYAAAVYGKAQMRWKTGFRQFLGLQQEKTDEAIIDEHEHKGLLMTQLDVGQEWAVIVGNDAVPELKDVLAIGSMQALCDFLGQFEIMRDPDVLPKVIDLAERKKRRAAQSVS